MANTFATIQTLIGNLVQAVNAVVTAVNRATPVPPASSAPGNYIRINAGATGYEAVTPASVATSILSSTASTATAGSSTLPSAPAGFVEVTIGSTVQKIPYYNV